VCRRVCHTTPVPLSFEVRIGVVPSPVARLRERVIRVAKHVSLVDAPALAQDGQGCVVQWDAMISTVIFLDTCTTTTFTGWEIDGNAKATNLIGAKACTDCEISFNKISSGGLSGQIFTNGNTRLRVLFNTLESPAGTSRGMWLGNYAASQMETDVLIVGNKSLRHRPRQSLLQVSGAALPTTTAQEEPLALESSSVEQTVSLLNISLLLVIG
jgi:hypothetical protein